VTLHASGWRTLPSTQIPRNSGQPRSNDPQPHSGGALLVNSADSEFCTSGFTVSKGGTNYLVTAGHCYDLNTMTYNATPGINPMGSVVYRATTTVDDELIQSYAQGKIYVGPTTLKPVAGAYDPVASYNQYCLSGYWSGVTCGHTDLTNGGYFCPYFCANWFTIFGGTPPQQGDSGAPWYLDGGSWVSVSATLSGHWCPSGSTTGCSIYASPWTLIKSYFGVSIVLG
jgi:hypothetical protein